MNDMTIKDALDYLDNVCVCHGCECLQDHDWGGCYRTTTTGKMACDLRDEAVEVLRKVVFRVMGAAVHYYIESGYKCDIFQELKDLPSAEPERKKGEWIYDTERVMNNGGIYRKYHCSECGQQIIGAVRNFCPYCGAEMNRGDR